MNIKTLRKATVTELAAALSMPVIDSKVLPNQLKSLPVAIVFNDGLAATNFAMNSYGTSETVTVQIDILTAYSQTDYADALDDAVETTINTLMQSSAYQELWAHIESYQVDYNYQAEAEAPIAFASIKLTGNIFKN